MNTCCKKVTGEEEILICGRYLDEMIAIADRLSLELGIGGQRLSQSEARAVLVSGLINGAYMQLSGLKGSVQQIGGIHQTLINEGERKVHGFNEWLKRHASFLKRVDGQGTISALASKLGDEAAAYRSATAFGLGEMLSCNGGLGAALAENRALQDEIVAACASLRRVLGEIYGVDKGGSGCLPMVILFVAIGCLVSSFL
jgi:hypothetical protein